MTKSQIRKICLISLSLLLLLPSLVFAAPNYKIKSMPDEHPDKVAYMIWSVIKGIGGTDEQAAGVIANAQRESQLQPDTIEGIYNNKEARTKKALEDLEAYTVNELFPAYIKSGWGVRASSNGRYSVAYVPSKRSDNRHILSSGYISSITGKYGPGVGLFQQTGDRASKLIEWAKHYNREWTDATSQLAYMLIKEDPSGYTDGRADWIFDKFIPNKALTPEAAAVAWLQNFEGIDGGEEQTLRGRYAREWYTKFKGSPGDRQFAAEVLKIAGAPMQYGADQSIEDVSLVQDLSGPGLKMKQNSGHAFDIHGKADEFAKQAATDLYKSTINNSELDKRYSLYERFGSDIHFYRYFGEETVPIQLLDHIYSGYKDGKLGDLGLSDTIFYKTDRYLSTKVYNDRPEVLTVPQLTEGRTDTRTTTAANGRFTGLPFVIGEIYLSISKFITSFVGFLMGPQLIETIYLTVTDILNTDIIVKLIKPVLMGMTALSIVPFIISLVGLGIKYAKGQAARREFYKRFLMGALSIGLIFTLVAKPTAFNEIFYKTATIADKTFNQVFNVAYEGDDIIHSTEGDKAIEAAIWKKTIFEPWVQGQFNKPYNYLYTTYEEDLDGNSFMPQDHTSEDELKAMDEGQFGFNSAKFTGDVQVPLGKGKPVRNWAAYLYSTQSKYHIDQNVIDGMVEEIPEELVWPTATTTANDRRLNADAFRVIDAQMNISPQIYNDLSEVANYTNSRFLDPAYVRNGRTAVFYSIILAFTFFPVIFKKLYNLFMLLIAGFSYIIYFIKELFKQGSGTALVGTKTKNHLMNYMYATVQLFVLTTLYTILIGNGFIYTIVYLLLAFVVLGTSIRDVQKSARDLKNNTKRTYQAVKNRF